MYLFSNGKDKALFERSEDITQKLFHTVADPEAIKSGVLELLQTLPDCKEIEFKANKKVICSIQKINVIKGGAL